MSYILRAHNLAHTIPVLCHVCVCVQLTPCAHCAGSVSYIFLCIFACVCVCLCTAGHYRLHADCASSLACVCVCLRVYTTPCRSVIHTQTHLHTIGVCRYGARVTIVVPNTYRV